MNLEQITQDTKIAQQIIKEAVKNGGDGVTVNIIGKIEISRDKEVSTQNLGGFIDARPISNFKRFNAHDIETWQIEEKSYLAMKMILEAMPEPKFDAVIKLMFDVANQQCATLADVGAYLGIAWHRARDFSKKFKLIGDGKAGGNEGA